MGVHPLDAAGSVPDVATYFKRYASESRAARTQRAMLRDLAYGAGAAERLDVFPAGNGAPLAIFFHGGYWRRLDKSDFSFLAHGFVPLGISLASVNYGLAPGVPLREIVAQARRAVRWCRENHEWLGVDASRISVFGHSAGGHLAAMCAVGIPVNGVATISGLHDLAPVQQSFANEWLRLDEREAAQLSPVNFAPARPGRLYAAAGAAESDAFKAQGGALVDAWSAYGCAAEYEEFAGDDHFSICLRMLDPGDRLTTKIAEIVI
ncbi:MAG: alpha/beta hydrolase [Candidatus Velthaea sp.]|jgi:arylformamidase